MHKLEDYPALSDDEVQKLGRSKIRYALHAYRLGNINGETSPVINYYKPRLDQYKLLSSEFGVDWDVAQDDPRNIVSGHIVRMYNEVLNSSLFNEDGSEKDTPAPTKATKSKAS